MVRHLGGYYVWYDRMGISHIGKVSNLLLILDAVSIVLISIIVAIINFSAIKKIRSLKDL